MIYRQLGKTGLKLSQLGFGAMRLPMIGEDKAAVINRELAIPVIHRAFELGVNYIDTAVFYCNSDSQRVVGEALKGWRDKVIVSTKNHYFGPDEKEWWQNLEDSLKRLDIDYIDLYHHHGVDDKKFFDEVQPRVRKWMEKARDQGLIKHICVSFHDTPEVLDRIIDSGYPQAITLQYNMLDRKLEPSIAKAHEAGIGIIVMGPVAGGRLGLSDVLSKVVPGVERVPELALRFVLANPGVTVALSGMETIQHVQENTTTASDPVALKDSDKAAIEEHLERLSKMADLYCTGCKYCTPCPRNVNIPSIFGLYNRARVYGLWDFAKRAYGRLLKNADDATKDQGVPSCNSCGACEKKCPQNIPIRKQLSEAHKALT